ncbi:lipase [Legionella lansingensis]|uniref:Lipase n=1 Tax=Legionella lansingensis TaxID=45067 RepID=A0A0W0VRF4_9GAMM|nr:alpha/beta fold hydrolase [Legionella lansingensis]KTD22732.1 lipase [Legionella lansingensis]SNV56693.1 lipase [Legionella lansingensis]
MQIDDFRGMRRGIPVFTLNKEDTSILAPIDRRGRQREHALLLLHGFTSTPAVFRAMLPSFSFYDAIICPMLPGHGESIETFAKTKASAWFAVAEQSCERLLREYKHVDVLGLSLGGILACHLGNRFDLNYLYLLAPAFDLNLPLPELSNLLKLVKFLNWLGFREIRGLAGDLYTNLHCEIAYRKLPLSSIMELLTLIQQFPFALPKCPTDVFLGCHDKVVASLRVAERFADQPSVTIHWLSNSAHVIPLDGDTESIIGRMKRNLIYCSDHNHEDPRDPSHACQEPNLDKP